MTQYHSTALSALTALILIVQPAFGLTDETANVQAGDSDESRPVKMTPKPLSENVKKGLHWLVQHQLTNGGWGQGEESQDMGRGTVTLKDVPNVAETSAATLALLRSGSSPDQGDFAANIRRALDYLCGEIEKADGASLFITDLRGTRLQSKLGTYIDTFMAALVLAEVKDRMPDEAGRKRIIAALDKVMDKIEKNQRPDGTWANQGWAPALAQAMGGKAINKAKQAGIAVSNKVLVRAERYAQSQFDSSSGKFRGAGSANVELYSAASTLDTLREADATNALGEEELRARARNAKSPEEKQAAQQELKRIAQTRADLRSAEQAVIKRLDDKRFIAGFGSNGGEEFLSYLNIGETLVVKGGPEWEKWDKSMTGNLNQIQNQDGSWTGHHCVTGRTFCTSTVLLVLMVDRAPGPLVPKLKRGY